MRYTLEVDFLEAVKGARKRITLPSGDNLEGAIPKGTADGQTIRLRGKGGEGYGGGELACGVGCVSWDTTDCVRGALPDLVITMDEYVLYGELTASVTFAFEEAPASFVLADIGADSLKTGMLHSAGVINAVAQVVEEHAKDLPLAVDPVMAAKGGQALLEPQAVKALRSRLIPLAHVLTPNIPEAEALSGEKITDKDSARRALEKLGGLGPEAVLLKGGHLPGAIITDFLLLGGDIEIFESPRIDSRHTHGTGCTLASAIAAGLAQGLGVRDAVERARRYVQEAIRAAPGYGKGHGPLNHAHTVKPFS